MHWRRVATNSLLFLSSSSSSTSKHNNIFVTSISNNNRPLAKPFVVSNSRTYSSTSHESEPSHSSNKILDKNIEKKNDNSDLEFTTTRRMCSNEEKKQDVFPAGIAHKLARHNILELQPYRCARDDYSDGILLDANENAYGPPNPAKRRDVGEFNQGDEEQIVLERYPDPYQVPLKRKVTEFRGHGLTPANVFVGVGSDEAIDLLLRIFCRPGVDAILTTPPTYGMYKVCAKVNDVNMVNVPLTPDFDLRVPEILAAITPNTKLIFLCSPGNPTAKALSMSDVEAVVTSAEAQANSIVVVDEAYIDFCTHPNASALELLSKYPNVVVLQTLSKAFGLAAIRCGFCFGAPDVIQLMNNVKAPYNVNALTSKMAIEAFDHIEKLNGNVQLLLDQRAIVVAALHELDFVTKVFPSDSNFVLFRMKQYAQECYKNMADGGVVTRYRGAELHCEECIRVTIGKPNDNSAFLKNLVETYRALEDTNGGM